MFRGYLRLRRRHRAAFTLLELMIVIAIIGILSSLAVVKYENFVCKTQRTEAEVTLRNIVAVEGTLFAEKGSYGLLPMCTFGYGGQDCTGTNITIEFRGRSRYSYLVGPNGSGFLAMAVGTSGHVIGDTMSVDQDGTFNTAATVCGN